MKLKFSEFSQANAAVAPLGRSLRTGSCRIFNPEAAATAGRCHNFKQTQWSLVVAVSIEYTQVAIEPTI